MDIVDDCQVRQSPIPSGIYNSWVQLQKWQRRPGDIDKLWYVSMWPGTASRSIWMNYSKPCLSISLVSEIWCEYNIHLKTSHKGTVLWINLHFYYWVCFHFWKKMNVPQQLSYLAFVGSRVVMKRDIWFWLYLHISNKTAPKGLKRLQPLLRDYLPIRLTIQAPNRSNWSPPGQNGCHFDIFRCIFTNEKFFLFWSKFHRSLFPSVQSTINQHWFR